MTIDGLRAGLIFGVAGATIATVVDLALHAGYTPVAGVLGFVGGLIVQQVILWSVIAFVAARGLVRLSRRG